MRSQLDICYGQWDLFNDLQWIFELLVDVKWDVWFSVGRLCAIR